VLNVWIDDKRAVEDLHVPATPGGSLLLAGAVSNDVERFSRENLDDDVYDAVFINLTVRDGNGNECYSYAAPEEPEEEEKLEETAEKEEKPRENFFEWLLRLVGLGRKAE
jgi:hypothetical protein